MTISVGDMLPNHTLTRFSTNGLENSKLHEIISSGLSIIFGVPGAYSRTCSKKHLPSFIRTMPKFKEIGVNKVVCISVNDPFVMKAWGEDRNVGDDVMMLSDGNGEFTAAIGLEMDGSGFGLGTRSQRYAMIIDDGVVSALNVEPGPGLDVSSAETILGQL